MRAMILDSLIENVQHEPPSRSWPTVIAFALQAAGIAVLVLLPLYYTGALPPVKRDTPPFVTFPGVAKLPHVNITTVHMGTPGRRPQGPTAPIYIPTSNDRPVVPEPQARHDGDILAEGGPEEVGRPTGFWPGVGGSGRGRPLELAVLKPPAPVQPTLAPPKRFEISTGVSERLLLRRVEPLYPRPAMLARIEGDVVLTAVIGTEGKVEQLQARSGHPLLIAAALDAVREWRYRPYLLNGRPTEVGAQITVAFRLAR